MGVVAGLGVVAERLVGCGQVGQAYQDVAAGALRMGEGAAFPDLKRALPADHGLANSG